MEIKEILKKLIWITVGQFVAACAFNLILLPNQLVATGFGGIATVLNNLYGTNIQLVLLILCLPVFFWSIFFYDRKQVLYAIFSYGMFTFDIGYAGKLFPEFKTDPVIATIAGGFLLGLAGGIIFKQAVANGPESIIAFYLKDKRGITIGTFFIILNTIIITSSILYGDLTMIIYSLLCNLITSKVMDMVIVGTQRYYVVRVMSDHYLEITEFITKDLRRGVTFIHGMDTANVKKKILVDTILSKLELIRLNDYIKQYNDDSFVYVTEAAGLIGRGYPLR